MKYDLGILAYGSLINNPGEEIKSLEIDRIKCVTPFKVEFARKSSTRGNAPTLIPVNEGGGYVNAVIIVLKQGTELAKAKSILWRRECHKVNSDAEYREAKNLTPNKVVVKTIDHFMDVQTVLYTSIGRNIEQELTGELLADLAIASILGDAGEAKKDGLRYLQSAMQNRIITPLTDDYVRNIIQKINAKTLEEAIEILDRKRIKTHLSNSGSI